jgi:hypothetical protein
MVYKAGACLFFLFRDANLLLSTVDFTPGGDDPRFYAKGQIKLTLSGIYFSLLFKLNLPAFNRRNPSRIDKV